MFRVSSWTGRGAFATKVQNSNMLKMGSQLIVHVLINYIQKFVVCICFRVCFMLCVNQYVVAFRQTTETETTSSAYVLEALLTAQQARKIACRYQRQAAESWAELTSPDGGLRRRTSQVRKSVAPISTARRRMRLIVCPLQAQDQRDRILCSRVSLESLLISALADH